MPVLETRGSQYGMVLVRPQAFASIASLSDAANTSRDARERDGLSELVQERCRSIHAGTPRTCPTSTSPIPSMRCIHCACDAESKPFSPFPKREARLGALNGVHPRLCVWIRRPLLCSSNRNLDGNKDGRNRIRIDDTGRSATAMSALAARNRSETRTGKRKEREEDGQGEEEHLYDAKRRAYACLAVVGDGWKELPRMKPIQGPTKPIRKGRRKRARIGKPKISFAFRFQTKFDDGEESLPELQRTVKESETKPTGELHPTGHARQGTSSAWRLGSAEEDTRTSDGSGLLGPALKEFQGKDNKSSFIAGAIEEAKKGSKSGTAPLPNRNQTTTKKQETATPSVPIFQFGKENNSMSNQTLQSGFPQTTMLAQPEQAGAAPGPAQGPIFGQGSAAFGAPGQGTTQEPQMKFSLGGAAPVPGRRVVRARRRPR